MKILYRQSMSKDDPGSVFLQGLGVKQCYFKHLFTERDAANITLKQHHHTHYEVHMVESGCSAYEANGTIYTLNCGQFLLLPPQTPHRVTLRHPETSTLSITFRLKDTPDLLPDITNCVVGQISPDIRESVLCVLSEHAQGLYASSQVIAAALARILILLWRICGIRKVSAPSPDPEEDPRLALAVQYIQDNIEFAPTVSEVSAYCHLSTKQLTRLFLSQRNIAPSDYIRKLRVSHMETLLKDPNLSLQTISERMHFSSEYYFNTFFKRHAGVTPGEFRKMHKTNR